MIQRIDVPVTMRDGAMLSADIRMPDRAGPFPAILIRTPYNNTGCGNEAGAVSDGYAVVKQDCRGRFDSGGVFDPFHEAEDGADTLGWMKAQPWCDGRIGMLGNSYNATCQLMAAWTRPPGLLAITPGVMGCDLFKDLVYHNGVFNLSLAVTWGLAVSGRSGQAHDTTGLDRLYRHLPLETMDEAAGFRVPHYREWLAHPAYDRFWEARSVERHYADFDVPALHMGGWYDFYSEGTTRNFAGIRSRGGARARAAQRLIMGPWLHGMGGRITGQVDFGETAVMGLEGLSRRWLDHWVKGIDNGVDREAPVRLFFMGENGWRDMTEWPPAGMEERSCYLSGKADANSLYGGGLLVNEAPSGGTDRDRYRYDPRNPVPTVGGGGYQVPNGATDHAPIERRDDVLVYTGPRLASPLTIAGPVRAVLYVSSDCPDTDFVVRLCDLYPDGRSIILCDGIARARFREGLDREVFMKPGAVHEMTVPAGVTAHVFKPGHAIRVEVTSSCFPRFARNLNTGESAASGVRMKEAQQTVWHSTSRPSRLILPVLPETGD